MHINISLTLTKPKSVLTSMILSQSFMIHAIKCLCIQGAFTEQYIFSSSLANEKKNGNR